MKPLPGLAWLAAMAALMFSPQAEAQQRSQYEKLVALHAKANNLPEALVHRVIVRESKYHPDLVGRGGTIGLMQIKLATARGLGYKGDAEGLRDPDTNLTYGVKYLAGAWRAADSDPDRAVKYYASGYYYAAKRQRLERPAPMLASALPKEVEAPKEAASAPVDTAAKPEEAAKPQEATAAPNVPSSQAVAAPKPKTVEKPKNASKSKSASKPLPGPFVLTPILAKLKAALTPSPKASQNKASQNKAGSIKAASKKLAEARERVPHPPSASSGGANGAKPR